jgi:excisionase family DNA binding protein
MTLLLTEEQAAERLNLCTRTLRKARQEGALTYVLIGRAVRYTVDDLAAFVEGAKRQDQPCPKPKTNVRAPKRRGNIVPFTARP